MHRRPWQALEGQRRGWQVERVEGPSGQLRSRLAAISGFLAGGVSGAEEQTPVGVTQAWGCGWGYAGAWLVCKCD